LIFIIISISVFSQKRIYHTEKIKSKAPKIDGIIDEPVWDQVKWAGDFTQWMPSNL